MNPTAELYCIVLYWVLPLHVLCILPAGLSFDLSWKSLSFLCKGTLKVCISLLYQHMIGRVTNKNWMIRN